MQTPQPPNFSDTQEPAKKKRKSWGQVLPKPTTNLPPRKRAKTEEEKAQRKYERVQRNRQAAHQSRMRKQDEMEQLKLTNAKLKQDNEYLTKEMSRLRDELHAFSANIPRGQPLTPPASNYDAWGTPSLTTSHSPTGSPLDHESIPTPITPLFDNHQFLADCKQFDASHSAAMCSQPWTSNSFHHFLPIKQEPVM